jgi:hypothetical protein
MKRITEIITLTLIAAFLFTGCDVPDISEFTEQSTEMTRGIREGVKDTGSVLETAAANDALFELSTREAFKKHSKNYNAAMKPTLETLDALDGYLDALNALARANKKSAENSKALVGAVSGLVASASKLVAVPAAAGVEIPETVLKIGTGILASYEQFRTAKSFKKRVNAAAEIVEGRYREVPKQVSKDGTTETIVEFEKICTDEKKAELARIGKDLLETQKAIIERIENDPKYKSLSDKEKKEFKKNALNNELKAPLAQAEKDAAEKVREYGCGVIDLLRFTMQDLKQINKDVSGLSERNFAENNRVTFNLYRGIEENNSRIQREISFILKHRSILAKIKDDEFTLSRTGDAKEKAELERRILNNKQFTKFNLDSIYMVDGQAETDLLARIKECDAPADGDKPAKTECAGMKEFIECTDCTASRDSLNRVITSIKPEPFHFGNGLIEGVLDARTVELFALNKSYLEERERIKPDYERIYSELYAMKASQTKLDKLLGSSIDALNTWTATHVNLRLALNTKKALSVATLAAKVKEIWAILEPEKAE